MTTDDDDDDDDDDDADTLAVPGSGSLPANVNSRENPGRPHSRPHAPGQRARAVWAP